MTSTRSANGSPAVGLGAPSTQAVLIGTGTHAPQSGLLDVPAVSTTLIDLKQALVQQCGMVEDNVRVLADPRSPLEVGHAVTESAKQATDTLFVYYVGHGLISPGGELYLATTSTERKPELLAYTALAYSALRTSLLESPARSTVVLLDCCFSGKATDGLGAHDDVVAVDLAQISGGYVLTSAAGEELALAPAGARYTAFTGELIGLLTAGDPDGPLFLTLRHAFRYLSRVLPMRGFPRPHCRASERIDDLVLAPNIAYRPADDTSLEPDKPADDVCPYPGLAAFQAKDARWFFGRERVILELVDRLAICLDQACPLVLVGASGSGKSSLLRAGLLPALSAGMLPVPGSRAWPQLLLTPTADPVSELAAQVARLAGMQSGALRAELMTEPDGFAATVRRVLRAWAGDGETGGTRVVVVVDQFEETFLRCSEDRDRQTFIRALCAAAGAGQGVLGAEPPALVVLGMRADLYDRCAAYPELLPALQKGQVVLSPMRTAELQAVIERPARAAGLTVEPGLVETLLRDWDAGNGSGSAGVGSMPCDAGALPLLSHALHATWEHRENNTLTVAGYQAAGDIRGAVATTAEAMFQEFDPAGQRAARRLLLCLVQIGHGVADTRRRADWKTLITHSPDPAAASVVFDAFARARFITADQDAAEITYEALLRAWPRLHDWIDADRAGSYVRQQLAEAAQRWDRDGRPASTLYRDTALTLAQDWAREPDHHSDLGTLERDFLTASQELRTRQQEASLRHAHRVRQLTTAFVVLLVVSLAGGGLALFLSRSTPPQHGLVTVLTGHINSVDSVAFSPDGHTLASGSADRTVRLWNVTNPAHPTPLGPPLTGHIQFVDSVAFSPDGHTLASGSIDHTVRLWNVTNPTHPTPLGPPLTGHTNSVYSVAFSPDGHTLASGSIDRTVWLWDVTDPAHPIPLGPFLTGHTLSVDSVAFSPDGHTLATGSNDQTVRLWNVTDPAHPKALGAPLTGHTDSVHSVAFSPDGHTLATGSTDRTVRLWNVTDPTHPTLLGPPLTGHTVDSVSFSPDRHTLATGSTDQTVQRWNVTDPTHPIPLGAPLTGHTDAVNSVAFSPDGHTLASGSTDHTVRLWSLP